MHHRTAAVREARCQIEIFFKRTLLQNLSFDRGDYHTNHAPRQSRATIDEALASEGRHNGVSPWAASTTRQLEADFNRGGGHAALTNNKVSCELPPP